MDDQPPNPTEERPPLKNSPKETMLQETEVDDQKKRETEFNDEKERKKKNRDDSVDRSADSSTSSGIHDAGGKKRETMPGNEKIEMSDMIDQESRVDDDDDSLTANKEGEKVVSSEIESEKIESEIQGINDDADDDEEKKKITDNSVDRSADSSTSSEIHDHDENKRQTMKEKEKIEMSDIDQESRVDDLLLLTANKEGEKVVSSEIKSEKLQPEEIQVDEGTKPQESEVDDEKKKRIRDDSVDPSADSSTTKDDKENKRGKEKIEMSDQESRVEDNLLTACSKEGKKVVSSERDSEIQVHQGINVDDAEKKKKIVVDPSTINTSTSSGMHDAGHQKVAPPPAILLFSKQLDHSDTFTRLNRVVVDYCNEEMTETLARVKELNIYYNVNVFTKVDSVEYECHFERFHRGIYGLYGWGQIVTANRLKKGDMVLGWGNLVADDQFRCTLQILTDPDSKEQYIP